MCCSIETTLYRLNGSKSICCLSHTGYIFVTFLNTIMLQIKPSLLYIISYVGKHLSLRGGIDFEGPWRDLGGNPKSHPL